MLKKKIGVKIFLFLFLFFSIFNLSLPIFIDFLLTFLILYILKNSKSIFLVILLIISSNFFIIYIFNLKSTKETFYRPDEKFNLHYEKRYAKNVQDLMVSPHGDIYNIGKNKNIKDIDFIKEKKIIKFKTDNYGLRNDTKLNQAEIILVGDSFIVGTGNSQENIPSNILSKKLNINVSNIAYPTDPKTYEELIFKYQDILKPSSKFFIFYFEGNDFYQKKNSSEEVLITQKKLIYKGFKSIWGKYQKLEYFKSYYLSKVYPRNERFFKTIRIISLNINNKLLEQFHKLFLNKKNILDSNNFDAEIIKIFEINNIKVGFFKRYIEESKKKELETYIFHNEKILKKIHHVVFIPTKYRVYSMLLNDEINYNSGLDYLTKEYAKKNVKVYDLTKTFQSNANEYLKDGKLLFWKDDTHWNEIGIDLAMDEIKRIYLSQY
jgi:hypothetical protein